VFQEVLGFAPTALLALLIKRNVPGVAGHFMKNVGSREKKEILF